MDSNFSEQIALGYAYEREQREQMYELFGDLYSGGIINSWKAQMNTTYRYEPDVDDYGMPAVESGGEIEIPWSSKTVSDAAKDLDNGARSVTVDTRSQAEEIFLGNYQGDGYTNVTGMDAMDAKNLLGGKGSTYHWDDTFDLDGNLIGHGAGNPDSTSPHLQIHPTKGNVIRIFFGNEGGD